MESAISGFDVEVISQALACEIESFISQAEGDPRAADAEIMSFAREGDWVVFTHDLDFGTLLAHTQAGRPSVFQIRAQDVSPEHLGMLVSRTLRQFASELEMGALVTVDEARQRVRLLPLNRG